METQVEEKEMLSEFCTTIKQLSTNREYDKCKDMIYQAMARYPDAPQPHNLLGIVLEMTGNHTLAMRHFRAAWALDPSYKPANKNLNTFGTFTYSDEYVFDDNEIEKTQPQRVVVKEVNHMGRVIKKLETVF